VSLAEKTGALESILRELAAYYDRQERLRRTVRSSVGYPLLLFFIVLAVFFVFLTEVLPVFGRVFAQIGASMLPSAEAFLAFGLWLAGAKWWLLGALLLIAAAAVAVRLVPAWREGFSAAVSRLFSGTKTGRKIAAARVASAMSLAVAGASDINEALALSCEFASGSASEAGLKKCLELVLAGRSLSEAVGESGLFSPVYCRMLTVGERTGSLETIMADIARRTEQDMVLAVDRLTGRIEPAAVIVLSVCVGLLLLSVMLPLVGIMSVL
jgi:type IV pilus assembly protein PilC